jgi:hypothetical protein
MGNGKWKGVLLGSFRRSSEYKPCVMNSLSFFMVGNSGTGVGNCTDGFVLGFSPGFLAHCNPQALHNL